MAFSLAWRWICRGPFYPGWDIVGSAHGLYLASTSSPWVALSQTWTSSRLFLFWNSSNSTICSLIPGYLTLLFPWEYWAHCLTLALTLSTLGVILRYAGLPLRSSWIVLLAWGASPALLSFSIAGYPYATGFLPVALTLWIVSDERFRRHWPLALVASAATVELSWHLYELGKLVFVVYLIAAAVERKAPPRIRAIWLACGLVQVLMLYQHPGMNVRSFSFRFASPLTVGAAVRNLKDFLATVFVSQRFDLPALFLAGLASAPFLLKTRKTLTLAFLAQLLLVLQIAAHQPKLLSSRRLLTTDFYAMTMVACLFASVDGRSGAKRICMAGCVAILGLGNILQLADMSRFARVPVRERESPMPFARTLDYTTAAQTIDWCRQAKARVESGQKLIVIYNVTPGEGYGNPESAMERLYLSLGDRKFRESVEVYGAPQLRRFRFPSRPLNALESRINELRSGQPQEDVVGYYYSGDTGYLRRRPPLIAWPEGLFESLRRRSMIRVLARGEFEHFEQFSVPRRAVPVSRSPI